MTIVLKEMSLQPLDIVNRLSALIPDADTAPFAIAVSGGGDSMALLLMMHAAFPGRVSALTVDHGLRAESATEAAQVSAWCAAMAVPHVSLRWAHGAITGNLMAAARAARYDLMCAWCEGQRVPYLLTGHTRDDVVETLLMRLTRGAGVRGLGTMPAVRSLSPQVTLLRPLLHLGHAALLDSLRARGQAWIEDPSNQNAQFDRVKMRQLLGQGVLDPERVAMSAHALASANVALDWATARCFAEQAITVAGVVTFRSRANLLALPAEIIRRLLLQAMEIVRGPALPPRQDDLERLLVAFAAADWRGSTLGNCIFAPCGAGFRLKSER
jgi:tRNA(Ile)-lysidine synthase